VTSSNDDSAASAGKTLAWQLAVGGALLLAWQASAAIFGTRWISSPLLVLQRLWQWAGSASVYADIATTLTEMIAGVLIGVALGAVTGLLLGMSGFVAIVLRPIIFAVYSVPLVSLAPLLLMIFGIGMLPKIVLVATVVFFLVLFNTMKGMELIDRDLLDVLRIMDARWHERFRKVLVPSCTVWILSGVKVALPYALVAATVGEMMAATKGLGFLLTESGQKFDMTGLYATLFILMCLGLLVGEAGARIETVLLRWKRKHR